MMITVNGESRKITAETTLSDLLAQLGYVKGFAVALNGEFVPRTDYPETGIRTGDAVEILTPMQGG
ncbi:sulfur carrier protein ThiS [Aestuariispira insulae]|uniref:Sulfur carrier protein n=1 Tax=Aestuariispira insulae TaxID=1461337 RepID=A0A3D9HPP4_9PROT|nr:sulfur carrier protein ThiS [Aestuariispira insulae]RED51458.1 sulfur carrier protein [Aestuariispira insulae]